MSASSGTRRKHRGRTRKHENLKRVPVSEWRIKYDGKDQGRRLAEFLKEIKMRCNAENISDRELLRGAIHLFSGRAKDWFMDGYENRDFRTWSELKHELKREFLPSDLDFQLEVQATSRRQARGEKFADYFHEMQKLFQSMTRPISERRRFEIIWRNMRFDYKNAMTGAGVRSLAKLKKYGRQIDENNWNMFQKSFEAPTRPKTNQVNEIQVGKSQNEKPNKGGLANNSRNLPKNKRKDGYSAQSSSKDIEKGTEGKNDSPSSMEGSAKGTSQKLVEHYKRPQ